MKFKRSDMGLYYHDIEWGFKCKPGDKPQERKDTDKDDGNKMIFVQSVKDNLEGFKAREIKDAKKAKRLMEIIGYPTYDDLETIVRFGQIKNNPVQVQDVQNARKIWKKSVHKVRGTMVRKAPEQVKEDNDKIPIPKQIEQALEKLVLCGDIFFVDGIPFLLTVTRKIGFMMIEMLQNRKLNESILPTLQRMIRAYVKRGAQVKVLMTDNEFESIGSTLEEENGVRLNISSANEHVPEVERNIRYIKEGTRTEKMSLPYKIMPNLLTIAIVKHIVYWLNTRIRKMGISRVYSPRTIITNTLPDYKVRCRLPVGGYCEVHDDPKPTNSTISRTTPAIVLEPVGNYQGGYRFYVSQYRTGPYKV